MFSLESELKGKFSSDNLLALVSGKPMSSDSIFLSLPRLRVLVGESLIPRFVQAIWIAG
jgi:hypothetical protein